MAPSLEVADARGAGDSMTAALAVAAGRGDSWDETLRLAAAAGATNVTRHGSGSGRLDTIRELARRVEIEPLQRSAA
jgi:1-phosphofructokinase